ncbi:sigma-70 family RNA polymerase sigma factor [Nocardioides marmoriginsengisoli]|uniref:Sigma-70 family RNA polymerase sigma factor n=1 Tax=Nocardioides marmoriginsengisoli TaxID=661483 RepID=A0A3N0CCQ0_9ACTN|nr:sigma-70 family RNA polymerase sigma factor [Nocardioides marmoriginsengisoli]RNL60826.1 sigma-70 family RNA polymerase sigma factor [Nocardioides marmoriginsengisoli]
MTILPAAPAPIDLHDLTDPECLDLVRSGDLDAFTELYRRHHSAVLRIAAAIAGPGQAADLTAEAFTRAFALLRRGRGPELALRSYLVTTIRNSYYDASAKGRRLLLVDDLAGLDRLAPAHEPWDDLIEDQLVADAFASLPDRWRRALWLTAVEGRSTAEAAEIIGISPSAVAQLTFRAREALRVAYLAQHTNARAADGCRRIAGLLPGYVRGSEARRGLVEAHLVGCATCAATVAELRSIGAGMVSGRRCPHVERHDEPGPSGGREGDPHDRGLPGARRPDPAGRQA